MSDKVLVHLPWWVVDNLSEMTTDELNHLFLHGYQEVTDEVREDMEELHGEAVDITMHSYVPGNAPSMQPDIRKFWFRVDLVGYGQDRDDAMRDAVRNIDFSRIEFVDGAEEKE